MNIIYLFSQNLKLDSIVKFADLSEQEDIHIFLTTHKLFDYEIEFIKSIYHHIEFLTFSDLLDDFELEMCDHEAYSKKQKNVFEYWEDVKQIKNEKIIEKIKKMYPSYRGYVLSDDLGIFETSWIHNGFIRLYGEYYYTKSSDTKGHELKKKLKQNKKMYRFYRRIIAAISERKKGNNISDDVYVSEYNGRKIIFIGRMSRIEYRMDLKFECSLDEKQKICKGIFYDKKEAEYISTLHESGKCCIPDKKKYDVKYIQDGYLPANYSNYYLRFKPKNVRYYAWDTLGEKLFINHQLPVGILPYRKKLYLLKPKFSNKINKVLIATSGSGDWTALKNRSDDDIFLQTFIEVAKYFPTIEFVYRCHPTWIHPEHVGVNSISRASEYVDKCSLNNFKISSNIPVETLDNFILSLSRSTLEDDMKDCDVVFGEHSVSMIDAGFRGIPFCAVNVTKRRSLFQSMVDLGFPECYGVDTIIGFLNNYTNIIFQKKYMEAVKKYNLMTDESDK